VAFYEALLGAPPAKLLHRPHLTPGPDHDHRRSARSSGGPVPRCAPTTGPVRDPAYWPGLSFRWAYQFAHNSWGVLCVLDIIRFRPLPAGLITREHPWATGLNPATGRPVWHDNVLFRSPPGRARCSVVGVGGPGVDGPASMDKRNPTG
jgi:hypothetical protein